MLPRSVFLMFLPVLPTFFPLLAVCSVFLHKTSFQTVGKGTLVKPCWQFSPYKRYFYWVSEVISWCFGVAKRTSNGRLFHGVSVGGVLLLLVWLVGWVLGLLLLFWGFFCDEIPATVNADSWILVGGCLLKGARVGWANDCFQDSSKEKLSLQCAVTAIWWHHPVPCGCAWILETIQSFGSLSRMWGTSGHSCSLQSLQRRIAQATGKLSQPIQRRFPPVHITFKKTFFK